MSLLNPQSVGFITGAGGAVGRATVLQFARDGVLKITGVDISSDALAGTAEILQRQFPAVAFLQINVDITKADQVKKAIDKTVAEFGRLDYAVNNAAIGHKLDLTQDTSAEEFDKILGVNLKGLWHCEREQLKQMASQDQLPSFSGVPGRVLSRGAIVNVDSVLGLLAMPKLGLYTMSKHAVVGLTRTDALDYAEKGIRVNCVCPGFIDTPLLDEDGKREALDPCISKTPMKRLANPQEIADAIAFLCSERSSYITGIALRVDGGYCLH